MAKKPPKQANVIYSGQTADAGVKIAPRSNPPLAPYGVRTMVRGSNHISERFFDPSRYGKKET